MSDQIEFRCGHCDQPMHASWMIEGQPCLCPACKQASLVPVIPRYSACRMVAWALITVNAMVAFGNLRLLKGGQQRDPSADSLMHGGGVHALAGTIGFLIGINVLLIAALVLGVYMVRSKEDSRGMRIVWVTLLCMLINAILAFVEWPT